MVGYYPNLENKRGIFMNKTELIAAVAAKTGITKKDAESIVSATFDTIAQELQKGEKVQVSGFGIFEVKNREARVGRNPHTKESIQIPASKVPVFKAAKALKETVGE